MNLIYLNVYMLVDFEPVDEDERKTSTSVQPKTDQLI